MLLIRSVSLVLTLASDSRSETPVTCVSQSPVFFLSVVSRFSFCVFLSVVLGVLLGATVCRAAVHSAIDPDENPGVVFGGRVVIRVPSQRPGRFYEVEVSSDVVVMHLLSEYRVYVVSSCCT